MTKHLPYLDGGRPLAALLARADERVEGDGVGSDAAAPHVRKHGQRILPPPALLARADQRVVSHLRRCPDTPT
eukprot:7267121-Pyramimonas_sp.AAC.2